MAPEARPPVQPPCSVIELRQYTTRPGRRDELITLFEREFIDTQEAAGIHLLGQFRQHDDPDRFVWLRGFADMAARDQALRAFYGSATWATHRDAANATLIDSDNVLLLRPAFADSLIVPVSITALAHAGHAAVEIVIQPLRAPMDEAALRALRSALEQRCASTGGRLLGLLVTESAPNSYPRLPVREGEQVLLWVIGFADVQTLRHDHAEQARRPAWQTQLQALQLQARSPAQVLLLAPATARSLPAN